MSEERPNKVYIGDSIYAEYDGYELTLTTDNGMGPSNTIFFDPYVLADFKRYLDNLLRKEPGEND